MVGEGDGAEELAFLEEPCTLVAGSVLSADCSPDTPKMRSRDNLIPGFALLKCFPYRCGCTRRRRGRRCGGALENLHRRRLIEWQTRRGHRRGSARNHQVGIGWCTFELLSFGKQLKKWHGSPEAEHERTHLPIFACFSPPAMSPVASSSSSSSNSQSSRTTAGADVLSLFALLDATDGCLCSEPTSNHRSTTSITTI